MTALHRKKPNTSEQGIALIVALLVLLLISAVGMGMIMMSNTETSISANFRDEQVAFFAARAGIEEVRDRMRPSATNSLSLSTTVANALPGGTNGVLYVTNPASGETVAPWNTAPDTPGSVHYPDDEICKEITCTSGVPTGTWYAAPQSASTSYAASPKLTWKWVRVMAKINQSETGTTRVTSVDGSTSGNRVCWNGTNEIATSATSCNSNPNYKPVYELTALAVTSSGSRRMIQYEATQSSFPGIPGAMVFDGSDPSFNVPSSSVFTVSGTDVAQGPTAGAGCPTAANQPALGAYDNTAVTSLGNSMKGPPDRSGQYTSSTPYTTIPAVANVNPTLSSGSINLTTVDGLTKLVNMVTAGAGPNVYPNGTTPTNMGTNTAPVVNVVQGDLSYTGSGAGILLVTGKLTLNGSFSYNGIILVIGEGAIVKAGGGSATVNGAMFAANLYKDLPGALGPGAYPAYTNPIALGFNNPPGAPYFGWSGGGSATIQYDSCWVSNITQYIPYRVLAQRELIY